MNKYCLDCHKEISKGHVRCHKCYFYHIGHKPVLYQNKDWLWGQYQKGLSFDSITKLANCGHTNIYQWFKKFGLKSRPAPCKGTCQRELNPNWKGGHFKLPNGYFYQHHPEPHAYQSKSYYVYEHILIMEKKIGRLLVKPETVHHLNGSPSDNRPENLMLFKNNAEHRRYEGQLGQFVKNLLWGGLSPNLKPELFKLLNNFLSKSK